MSKWEAIELWDVSGNNERILKRERVTGIVDVIPPPVSCSDKAWVLRPVESLGAERMFAVDEAKVDSDDPMSRRRLESEVYARIERFVCSNAGFKLRKVTGMSKKDAERFFTAKVGDVLTFKRCGWGETFVHTLKRVE